MNTATVVTGLSSITGCCQERAVGGGGATGCLRTRNKNNLNEYFKNSIMLRAVIIASLFLHFNVKSTSVYIFPFLIPNISVGTL